MSGGFPFFPELCGGNDQGTDTVNSRGTAFTAGSSAYGSYVQLVASTPRDAQWVSVNIETSGTINLGNGCKFKLAVGGAGSEIPLIMDVPFQFGGSGISGYTYTFPLCIPAGSRVSIAGYEAGHTDVFYASIILWDGGFVEGGVAGYDAIGVSGDHGTALTFGAANTKGSYAQLVAATAADYCGFFITQDCVDIANVGAQNLVDIAIGGAGSEQIIIPNLYFAGGPQGLCSAFYPIPIPAGTRIAARAQNVSGSGNFGVAVFGAYL